MSVIGINFSFPPAEVVEIEIWLKTRNFTQKRIAKFIQFHESKLEFLSNSLRHIVSRPINRHQNRATSKIY